MSKKPAPAAGGRRPPGIKGGIYENGPYVTALLRAGCSAYLTANDDGDVVLVVTDAAGDTVARGDGQTMNVAFRRAVQGHIDAREKADG